MTSDVPDTRMLSPFVVVMSAPARVDAAAAIGIEWMGLVGRPVSDTKEEPLLLDTGPLGLQDAAQSSA